MKMTKRSRKLLLSAGMLTAVATIPPVPMAEAYDCTATLTCPNGTVISCEGFGTGCHVYSGFVICGREVRRCPA